MEIKPKKQSFFRRNLFSIINLILIIISVFLFLAAIGKIVMDITYLEKILKQNNLTLKEETPEENNSK